MEERELKPNERELFEKAGFQLARHLEIKTPVSVMELSPV